MTVVVDYAAPNAAKEMHVGHLRSAIIGDCLVRLLELEGHRVIRENHIGDWGTPFGMLIEHLVDVGEEEAAHELAMGDLEAFYQAARRAYDSDPAFAERSRQRVVLLQSGDPETLRLWRSFVDHSVNYFDQSLRRLGTKLTRDDVVGESYYNSLLPKVVEDLSKKGLWSRARAPFASSLPGLPTARANRCRSSCRTPSAAITTPPPTWPRSGTASGAWVPTCSCTWWACPRPSTSRWSLPPPAWPAGCPRGPRPCTSGSVTSSGRTGRCSGPGRAGR